MTAQQQSWGVWEKRVRHPDGTVTWEALSKVRKSGTDEEKRARQRFARLMSCRMQPKASTYWEDCECWLECSHPHARVGQLRRDGTEVRLIGTVAELHGPDGVCTCCDRKKETP